MQVYDNLTFTDLRLGDWADLIRSIPDGNIDAIITDPPYEIATTGGPMVTRGGRTSMNELNAAGIDKGFDIVSFLDESVRLFATPKHYCGVFFCSMKQLTTYLMWAERNGYRTAIGVWHKTNPIPLCGGKYLNDVEYWLYIKGSKSKIRGEYATKSMVYSSQTNRTDKKLFDHPTIKPTELISRFVLNHTDECGTVLDPFMGTGTTGVVCRQLGRSFIGFEINEKHFNTSLERVNNE